jgi:hypothetical protein
MSTRLRHRPLQKLSHCQQALDTRDLEPAITRIAFRSTRTHSEFTVGLRLDHQESEDDLPIILPR